MIWLLLIPTLMIGAWAFGGWLSDELRRREMRRFQTWADRQFDAPTSFREIMVRRVDRRGSDDGASS